MNITEIIIQLVAALLGALGFAMMFGLRPRYYFEAALGGFLCWGLYLVGMHIWSDIFLSTLLASAFSALYSELIARIRKAPSTLFFITSVIPLVPGRSLYYACSNAVTQNWTESRNYANLTLQYALAIAAGACIVWAVILTVENIKKNKNAS